MCFQPPVAARLCDCWSLASLRQALARERARRTRDEAPPEIVGEVEREWTQMLADAVRPAAGMRPMCTPDALYFASLRRTLRGVRYQILGDLWASCARSPL